MDERSYHLIELAIAQDASDPRRSLPPIAAHHRRVLDIGCGAGQTLIASALPAGTLGVGVDIEHGALALGRTLAPPLHFLRARGEALPFAPASFDIVICRVALPYMHIGRALTEMARVLAPGGDVWLVLHPWQMTAGELFAAVRRLKVKATLYRAYVMASSVLFHVAGVQIVWPFGARRFESFQTERGIRRSLATAGFTRIHFQRASAFIVTARKR
jgi:ubiquinone/menaquinone biosynthesis C-methylase UbiE